MVYRVLLASALLFSSIPSDHARSQTVTGGTIAIVHRSNLGVFVGIDSRVTRTGVLRDSGPVCKIGTKDGVIFFGEGSVSADPIYDSYEFANSVISPDLSLRRIVDLFSDRVFKLAPILNEARRINPERFDSSFQESKLFDFTFIKYERDSIYFALCEFRYNLSLVSGLVISRRISLGANLPKPTMLYGDHEAISQEMRRAKSNTLGKVKTVSLLRDEIDRLLTLQIKQAPEHIGPPIQIIWMRNDGRISWLKNELPCEPTINR